MFCTYCGTEQVAVPTGRFDKDTGKPTTKLVCPNVNNCEEACYQNGGHHYTKFLFKQNYRKRCKNEYYDLY